MVVCMVGPGGVCFCLGFWVGGSVASVMYRL